MTNQQKLPKTLLAVFARRLVQEMQLRNYWAEWSSAPLKNMLPLFFDLLNYHPHKLGSIIESAYHLTKPISERSHPGNINQLSVKHRNLFGNTRQSYLDMYTASSIFPSHTTSEFKEKHAGYNMHPARPDHGKESPYTPEQTALLKRTICVVTQTFTQLAPEHENHHRTMENVIDDLARLYYLDFTLSDAGFDMKEYSDFWRDIPRTDRRAFAAKYFPECLEDNSIVNH